MITHVKCDIFESGADVILHQVNCQGVMGSGVAKQVREKFPRVFERYKSVCNLHADDREFLLGLCQYIQVDEDKFIGNLFSQKDYGYDGKQYTDYDALEQCLEHVNAQFEDKLIAIPYRMGCHRGGGDWSVVYKMIEGIFDQNDVIICEYDGG